MTPTLGEIGEKAAVSKLIKRFDPDGTIGLGDDCAIIDMGSEYLIATTDMVNQATHIPEGTRGWLIGWYAAAINLSDIASMGGYPLGLIFAMGVPREMEMDYLDDIARGIDDCASEFGAKVLGGDTKENPTISIAGTAFGLVAKKDILMRKGAKPGDILFLTGEVGTRRGWYSNPSAREIENLLHITPRVREGQILAGSGAVTSCIDLSDGLSTSLHHLMKAGNIGFEIEMDAVPFMPGLSEEEKAKCLHLGGEFELLCTLRPELAGILGNNLAGTRITPIGKVIEKNSIHLLKTDGRTELEDRGYEHFRKR